MIVNKNYSNISLINKLNTYSFKYIESERLSAYVEIKIHFEYSVHLMMILIKLMEFIIYAEMAVKQFQKAKP